MTPRYTLIPKLCVLVLPPILLTRRPFSTSSSPARALVTGEKLTFPEVSDDLITTKPKAQSRFQTHLSPTSSQHVTLNHLLSLEMLSDLSSTWLSPVFFICNIFKSATLWRNSR